MREDKRKDGKEQKTSGEVQQEELLADAFQACMEEQLSFIPPEREISRVHTFSPGFNAAMEELCRTKGKLKKREMTRREFVFGFNRIAACILLMFVVGGVCVGGYLLSEHSLTGAGSSGLAESTAESTEETADLAVPEEETTAAQDSTASGGQDANSGADAEFPAEKEFMGSMIPLAEEQSIPSQAGNVKTLVSSPVLDRAAESFKVTIGNLSETAVSYSTGVELQVYLDGAWYVVPEKQREGLDGADGSSGRSEGIVELEPGMAQDEEIWLANYDLDFEAEKYRAVVYVDGKPFGSEFWFEDLEEGLEEALESTLDNTERQ